MCQEMHVDQFSEHFVYFMPATLEPIIVWNICKFFFSWKMYTECFENLTTDTRLGFPPNVYAHISKNTFDSKEIYESHPI